MCHLQRYNSSVYEALSLNFHMSSKLRGIKNNPWSEIDVVIVLFRARSTTHLDVFDNMP